MRALAKAFGDGDYRPALNPEFVAKANQRRKERELEKQKRRREMEREKTDRERQEALYRKQQAQSAMEAIAILEHSRRMADRIKMFENEGVDNLSVRNIIGMIAEKHGILPQEIVGVSLERHVTKARFEAIGEVHKRKPHLSTPAIGRYFGNRDHTTILNALRRYEEIKARGE